MAEVTSEEIEKAKAVLAKAEAQKAEAPEFKLTPEQVAEKVTPMPLIETRIRRTPDYIVHETRIVDIKPVSYWDKVVAAAKAAKVLKKKK